MRKNHKLISLVQQATINQRLKFLIETLSASVRAFSEEIGESTGNTNNYIGSRQLAPKHEYLAKVLKHYSNVNAHWLLTGEGEPFLPGAAGSITQTGKINQAGTRNKQTVTSNKVGYQANTGAAQETLLRVALESANKEVALLLEQLTMKDQLIAAKEEMLSLLRSQFNRPN